MNGSGSSLSMQDGSRRDAGQFQRLISGSNAQHRVAASLTRCGLTLRCTGRHRCRCPVRVRLAVQAVSPVSATVGPLGRAYLWRKKIKWKNPIALRNLSLPGVCFTAWGHCFGLVRLPVACMAVRKLEDPLSVGLSCLRAASLISGKEPQELSVSLLIRTRSRNGRQGQKRSKQSRFLPEELGCYIFRIHGRTIDRNRVRPNTALHRTPPRRFLCIFEWLCCGVAGERHR